MTHVKWDEILQGERAPEGTQLPRFSIIIPSYNCSQKIAWTLQSLKAQTYRDVEVVVVDAGSTDRTLEEVRRRHIPNLRVCSVADFNRSEMYNRGISVAMGDYVSLMSPGDAYVYEGALEQLAHLIAVNERPDLAYCGALRREAGNITLTVLRELSERNLHRGYVPSSLAASYFKVDTIRQLGKLDAQIRLRGGFDLTCRFYKRKGLTLAKCDRVLVEHDRQTATARQTLRRFWETQKVIGRHFGGHARLNFWLGQNHWELVRLWWKSKRTRLWS